MMIFTRRLLGGMVRFLTLDSKLRQEYNWHEKRIYVSHRKLLTMRREKILLVLIIILVSSQSGLALNIDSLRNELATATNDTAFMATGYLIARHFEHKNLDSALVYINVIMDRGNQGKDNEGEQAFLKDNWYRFLFLKAELLSQKEEFSSSVLYYHKALDAAKKTGRKDAEAAVLIGLGSLLTTTDKDSAVNVLETASALIDTSQSPENHSRLIINEYNIARLLSADGGYAESNEILFRLLQYPNEDAIRSRRYAMYNQIGINLKNAKDYTAAKKYYLLGSKDPHIPANYADMFFKNIANLHYDLFELDSTEHYANKILAMENLLISGVFKAKKMLADVESDRGNYAASKKHLDEISPYLDEIQSLKIYTDYLFSAASANLNLHLFPAAKSELDELFSLITKYPKEFQKEEIALVKEKLIELSLYTSGDRQTLELFQDFSAIRDSIEQEKVDALIQETMAKYETKIRQDSIANLTIRSESAEALATSRTYQLVLSGGLGLGFLLGLFYIRMLNKKLSKRNKKIGEVNKQVQAQNEEITLASKLVAEKNNEITARNAQISRLNRDINHRSSNNLKNVKRLLTDQRKRAIAAGLDVSIANALDRQIMAYTKLQDQLKSNLTEVNLNDYLNDFCASLREAFVASGQPVIFDYNIAEVMVHPDFAAPLALIINELATNSQKYARREDGILKIALDANLEEDGELRVFYRDGGSQDGEIDPMFHSSGQGMELVKGFTWELEGEIIRYGDADGFDYEAVFEMAA